MEGSTTEEIRNFWSHYPNGMTFRELGRLSAQECMEMSSQPATGGVAASETAVAMENQNQQQTSAA